MKDVAERKVYTYEKREETTFTIHKEDEVFVIVSAGISNYMKRMNLTSYDAVMRFARTMRKMGVDAELRKMGAKDGDMVQIGDFAFEFFEGSDYNPNG